MKKIIFALFLFVPALGMADDRTMSRDSADQMFEKCDSNRDGKISKQEFDAEKNNKFSKYDTNRDGFLSMEEHEQMASDMHDMMMGEKSVS